MNKQEQTLKLIINACQAAGARPKVYLESERCITVALGREWMDEAIDVGNKYDRLIDELNQLSDAEMTVEPCGEVFGATGRRLF